MKPLFIRFFVLFCSSLYTSFCPGRSTESSRRIFQRFCKFSDFLFTLRLFFTLILVQKVFVLKLVLFFVRSVFFYFRANSCLRLIKNTYWFFRYFNYEVNIQTLLNLRIIHKWRHASGGVNIFLTRYTGFLVWQRGEHSEADHIT